MNRRNRRPAIEDLVSEYWSLRRTHALYEQKLQKQDILEMCYGSYLLIKGPAIGRVAAEIIMSIGIVHGSCELREIYKLQNLLLATQHLFSFPDRPLSLSLLRELHRILMFGINQNAGKFRNSMDAEKLANLMDVLEQLDQKVAILSLDEHARFFFLATLADFHNEFIKFRPFSDGNARLARLLVAHKLYTLGIPLMIVQSKSQKEDYYDALWHRADGNHPNELVDFFSLLLTESLQRHITLLKREPLLQLSDWARQSGINTSIANNRARRQTIPAFHQNGKWYIAKGYKLDQ